jgi:hypothetical protein
MWLGVCLWRTIDQVSEIHFMFNSAIHSPVQVVLAIRTGCMCNSEKILSFLPFKNKLHPDLKMSVHCIYTRVFGTGPANIYSKIIIYVLHQVNTLYINDEAPTPSLIHSNGSVSKHTAPPSPNLTIHPKCGQ